MKKTIALLIILMLIVPAACAELDYYHNTELVKAIYDTVAIMSGLPTISKAIEVEPGCYYFTETSVFLFLNYEGIDAVGDPSHFMGCMTTENTKMDDFLLTCACAIKTMNRYEDDTILYGQLLNIYIRCRKKYPSPSITQGTIYLMMQCNDGIYTFVVRAE